MQLVCPNCDAHYDISSSAIGAEGKNVRCVKCTREWFVMNEEKSEFKLPEGLNDPVEINDGFDQTADISQMIPPVAQLDTDEIEEDEDQDQLSPENVANEKTSEGRARKNAGDDDIPDAVKPRHDQGKSKKKKIKTPVPVTAKLAGYGAALLVFVIVFTMGFVFKNDIVKAWPPAVAIYNIAGMPVSFKGEGLIVETLSASVRTIGDNQDVLILEGRVINMTGETIAVPPLLAKLRTTNGEDGEGWIIDPPVEEIAPNESFSFKTDYPSLPRGIGSVNLTFVPTL
jgi:predicted Zn finger-like uncharacterized protein